MKRNEINIDNYRDEIEAIQSSYFSTNGVYRYIPLGEIHDCIEVHAQNVDGKNGYKILACAHEGGVDYIKIVAVGDLSNNSDWGAIDE